MRLKICLLINIFFFSCNLDRTANTKEEVVLLTSFEDEESEIIHRGKEWIKTNIEFYFANFDKNKGDFSTITTKDFFEFQTDATNVDIEGADFIGLTYEEFKKKWKKRFIEDSTINEPFLIDEQDFLHIEVDKIEFLNKTEQGGYLFKVTMRDEGYKAKYYRKIVIINSQNSFLIDKVIHI